MNNKSSFTYAIFILALYFTSFFHGESLAQENPQSMTDINPASSSQREEKRPRKNNESQNQSLVNSIREMVEDTKTSLDPVLNQFLNGPESLKLRRSVSDFIRLMESEKIRDRIALKAGPSITARKIRADNNTEADGFAWGLNTYFAFTLHPEFETGIGGTIFLGKHQKLQFNVVNERVTTSGSYRDTTFYPYFKYLPNWAASDKYLPYILVGPTFSQQTIKLEDFVDSRNALRKNHKLTFEAQGGILGFGVEENLWQKSQHASYIEILVSYMEVKKIVLVDASDFTEVETVSYEDVKKNINGFIFIINSGVLLF